MKKLKLIFAVPLAALMMQACHNNSGTTTTTDSTTTVKEDVSKTDTSKTMAVPDTGDVKFATAAASGGMTEIALSKLAVQQATSSKLKDFANMMITDHSNAGDQLAAIAKAKNITLPTGPNADQQNVINDLAKKTGSDFDKAYVKQMVTDHKSTLDMFQHEQTMVKDTALRSFISNTIPVVQKHLDAIKAIKSGM